MQVLYVDLSISDGFSSNFTWVLVSGIANELNSFIYNRVMALDSRKLAFSLSIF